MKPRHRDASTTGIPAGPFFYTLPLSNNSHFISPRAVVSLSGIAQPAALLTECLAEFQSRKPVAGPCCVSAAQK